MPISYYEKVWHNGEFIPWESATIHVAAHTVSYASCLFEGIRCYETSQGPAIFRLKDHTDRLVNSSKIYRIELDYSREQLQQAMVELVRVNKAKHSYIRPLVLRGYGEMGVNPLKNPVEVYLLAWKWAKLYRGHEATNRRAGGCDSLLYRLDST